MDRTELIRALESILFVSGEPVQLKKLEELFEPDGVVRADIKEALDSLQRDYAGRGVELHEVGGGYQMRTSPELGQYIARLNMGRPTRLSQAALESLAIIAYRQPVTRSEAEDVRGVDCGAVFRNLVERGLVRVVGKKDVPGRPLLYGTTRKFLEVFGLTTLNDLPTLRQIEELVTTEEDEIEDGAERHEAVLKRRRRIEDDNLKLPFENLPADYEQLAGIAAQSLSGHGNGAVEDEGGEGPEEQTDTAPYDGATGPSGAEAGDDE